MQSYGIEESFLRLSKNYLTACQQRIILNKQISSWQNVTAGVSHGSILRPLLFLVYINDLIDGITSSCKIFADNTSLFSNIRNKSSFNFQLNKDWRQLVNGLFSRKCYLILSHECDKEVYPSLKFDNNDVQSGNSQKQFRASFRLQTWI